MSCALGITLNDFAIVAADTRANRLEPPGVWKHYDEGELTISVPGIGEVKLGDRFRKICHLRNGWIAAVGTLFFMRWVFEAVRNTDAANHKTIARAIRKTYRKRVLAISQDRIGDLEEVKKTTFLLCLASRNGFALKAFGFDGGPLIEDGKNYAFLDPPHLKREISLKIQDKLFSEFPKLMRLDPYLCVQSIAGAFREVHLNNYTVSDILEVGLLKRQGNLTIHSYLKDANEKILGSSLEDLKRNTEILGPR